MKKKNEKILVTGGAGFIGSHVCDELLKKGNQVICVDNFNDYYDVNQKKNNIKEALLNKNFKLYKVDITDLKAMEEIFIIESKDNIYPFNKIIHLAARAGVRPSIDQPILYEEVNIKGTLNLLDLSKKYKITNFIYASSSSIYGVNKKVPFSEIDKVDNPISPYAATKKSSELLCYTYNHLYGINCICLRFFTVYGPRGRPDMAPFLFIDKVSKGNPIKRFGNGTSKRDYTYISDIVSGIIAALNIQGYEIINIGNNKCVELNYLISIIEKLTEKKAIIKEFPMQPGDVFITYANISKAQKILNYFPKVSIEEGLKNFYDWYKNR